MARGGSPPFRRNFAPRSWRIASGLLLLSGACRFASSKPLAPALSARARLLRIEDTRRDEPALVEALLATGVAPVRAAAALTVGRIGARTHLPTLRRLATDRDAAVAANALFSLSLLKDTAAATSATSALRAGPDQAREAARLLGELGEHGRLPIVSGLADASLGRPVHAALLLAAARLRPVPAAAVTPYLGSRDSALAWGAAYAIARGRSAAGTRALLAQANSPWASVREQVARGAIRTIAGDSLAALAFSTLERLRSDTSAGVRVNAIGALASYGVAARASVLAARADSDRNVRVSASQALAPVLVDTTAVTWIRAFDADTSFVVRRNIALAAVTHGVNLAAHSEWATSTRWQERAAAASLDGDGPAREAMARLSAWLQDADARVRAAATVRYAALADSSAVRASVRAGLRDMLADPDEAVRAAVLDGLARGGTPEDLAAAFAAYRLALLDVDNDARLAFWHLTDSVVARHVTTLPDSVHRMLAELARPADPIERNMAARISRFASWRDSTGAARPIAWYEARARELTAPTRIMRVETERGTMEFTLFASDAPLTVYNIQTLAQDGYFDGQLFHRVVPNFVIQAGDPRGDGSGGPGYAIRDELNRHRYLRGTLGMALSGPDTGGSQFFVAHSPQPHLDGGYTVFGQLSAGGDVLDRIIQGDRIVRVTIQ